jgi:hypothetical protein
MLHRFHVPYVNVELGTSSVHLVAIHALQAFVAIMRTHVHCARVLAHKLTITLRARVLDAVTVVDLRCIIYSTNMHLHIQFYVDASVSLARIALCTRRIRIVSAASVCAHVSRV